RVDGDRPRRGRGSLAYGERIHDGTAALATCRTGRRFRVPAGSSDAGANARHQPEWHPAGRRTRVAGRCLRATALVARTECISQRRTGPTEYGVASGRSDERGCGDVYDDGRPEPADSRRVFAEGEPIVSS